MAKQFPVKSRRKLLNPVFHLQTKKEDENQLTKGMIKVVRKSGQLNLSGRSLASGIRKFILSIKSILRFFLLQYHLIYFICMIWSKRIQM